MEGLVTLAGLLSEMHLVFPSNRTPTTKNSFRTERGTGNEKERERERAEKETKREQSDQTSFPNDAIVIVSNERIIQGVN